MKISKKDKEENLNDEKKIDKDIILKEDDNENNLEKLKNILNNSSNVNKEKTVDKQDNIIVNDRNYISKKQFEDEFNGWGFTFLNLIKYIYYYKMERCTSKL